MDYPPYLIAEPADVYHGKSDHYLSSHALADFRKCPELFHRKQLGLIPDSDSTAYQLGRAAHTLILEGREAYEAEYAVGGPVNPKTGQTFGKATKAFHEWAAEQGKPVLTDDEAALVETLQLAVASHIEAQSLLIGGVAEGVCRTTYCCFPCQVRPDYWHPDHGIVDLKTCDDLTWFESDARRFGYVYQLAFYRAVLFAASGSTFPVHIVAVEKKEPYRVGVWKVDTGALDHAEPENARAIFRLKNCATANTWPTGYEAVRVLDCV